MLHEVNFKNLEGLFEKKQCIGKTANVKQEECLNVKQLKPIIMETPDDSDSDYSYESDEYESDSDEYESEEYESEEDSSETDSHDSYANQGLGR